LIGTKERNFAPLIHVSLEELVPQDHFYRHLERTLDLSFVREFVQETYVTLTRFNGSSAFPVLSHGVASPRNQCTTALRDIPPKNHPSHLEEVCAVFPGQFSPLALDC
jgi:hypothetical protein